MDESDSRQGTISVSLNQIFWFKRFCRSGKCFRQREREVEQVLKSEKFQFRTDL